MRPYFRFRHIALIISLLAVLAFGLTGVSAQPSVLGYGEAALVTLDAGSPLAFITFTGRAGDLITARALAANAGVNPSISLLSPSQSQLANNDNDAAGFGATDAVVSALLSADGSYTLLVGSVSGAGQVFVRLDGRSSIGATPVSVGQAFRADFAGGAGPQVFALNIPPGAANSLALRSEPVGVPFAAEVRSPEGVILASFSRAEDSAITLPGAPLPYFVTIGPAQPDQLGAVQVGLNPAAGGAVAPIQPVQPVQPSQPNTGSTSGACAIIGATAVNIRSGPGTNFDIVGQVPAGSPVNPTGISPDRGWFVIPVGAGLGWVSATVVTVSGDCSTLPINQGPQIQPTGPTTAPQQPATQPTVAQPTVAGATQAPPTAIPPTVAGATQAPPPTQAPPTQPPPTQPPPTPTYTPTVAQQVAPPDNNYNVALDRNNGGQFSEVISNPGDTSDSIFVSVNNFDSVNNFAQFIVTLVCVGDGTQNVSWGFNQGGSNVCGGTANLILTNDSNNQRITLTLNGPGYVNYTFIFTRVG